MSFLVQSIFFASGLVIGLVLATFFWWKKLKLLHSMWQMNFSRVVGATVAHYLGGVVDENGVIHLGNNEETPPKEDLN